MVQWLRQWTGTQWDSFQLTLAPTWVTGGGTKGNWSNLLPCASKCPTYLGRQVEPLNKADSDVKLGHLKEQLPVHNSCCWPWWVIGHWDTHTLPTSQTPRWMYSHTYTHTGIHFTFQKWSHILIKYNWEFIDEEKGHLPYAVKIFCWIQLRVVIFNLRLSVVLQFLAFVSATHLSTDYSRLD